MKKEVREKPKHVHTVVNSIQPLPLTITNALSNTHNNPWPKVDCFTINLSKYSRSYQGVVSEKISYSYDCTKSYLTDSVVFQGSKSRICINLSTNYLKDIPDPLQGS